jgi:hypothetical protein
MEKPSITSYKSHSGGLAWVPRAGRPVGQPVPASNPATAGKPATAGQPVPAGQPAPAGQPTPAGNAATAGNAIPVVTTIPAGSAPPPGWPGTSAGSASRARARAGAPGPPNQGSCPACSVDASAVGALSARRPSRGGRPGMVSAGREWLAEAGIPLPVRGERWCAWHRAVVARGHGRGTGQGAYFWPDWTEKWWAGRLPLLSRCESPNSSEDLLLATRRNPSCVQSNLFEFVMT